MSASSDQRRQEELMELFVRHKAFMQFMLETGQHEALTLVVGQRSVVVESINTLVELNNPRDVELFTLGMAWAMSIVMQGPVRFMQDLIGDQAYAALNNAVAVELARICEAVEEHLPQVNRSN